MLRKKRGFVLAGAAISVVVLGILTNIATGLLPADYPLSPWIAWTALGAAALIFALFYFWQEKIAADEIHPPTNFKTLRQRYLQYLLDAYQYLEFKGIIQFEKLPLRMSLEKVYVNLWAQPELPTGETLKEELRLAGRKISADKEMLLDDELELMVERAKPMQVEPALSEHQALVILGDPGSGKSTLLKHLALNAAKNFDREKRLPILLPLAAYANALQSHPHLSLREFLPEFYKGLQEFPENPAPLFYDALENGKALVLLDGLDEVHDPSERSRVVHHVKNFYLNHRGNTDRSLPATGKFVITSRIVGYREAPLEAEEVFHLTLLDFNKEQISQFAENWCLTYEIAQSGDTPKAVRDAEGEKSKLLKSIFGNAGVEKLAANPLLLTILALIHRQGTELPNRRAELYELYLTTLIKTWNRARSLAGMSVGSMDDKETVKILAPLAYWMHANRPSGTARRVELEREITRHFTERRKLSLDDAEREAARFLDDVRTYSGLLAERGPDAYGFVHLTFEEYLAARHIVFQGQVHEQKSLELLRKHAYDPAWREVILLALGYLGLVTNEEEKTALLVRGLLNDQPPADHLGENIELAGSALKDIGRASVGEDCWKEVIDRLLTTMTHSAPPIIVRARCGDVLGELGDPRLEKMEWCEVREGEFLLGCIEDEIEIILQERIKFYQTQSWNFSTDDIQRWLQRIQRTLPQHTVFLPTFRIRKFPVTNQEFRAFWQSGGYKEKRWWSISGLDWLNRRPEDEEKLNLKKWRRRNSRSEPAFWNDLVWGIPNRPVVGITWFEAMAYCAWLNEQFQLAGELPKNHFARLPTEAEWEKAARGTDGRCWPWGNEWEDNYANTHDANLQTTSSVGIFLAGASYYNVLDMAGNSRDWCNTLLAQYPYDSIDGREKVDADGKRAVRGGSWLPGRYSARCAYRRHYDPDVQHDGLGFRVVIGPKLD